MSELLNTTDLDNRLDTKLEEIYLTQNVGDNNSHNFKGNYINSLGIYMSQIKASLLTPDEEMFYGELVFKGKEEKSKLSNNGHNPTEEESIQTIERGEKAEEIMILSNLALVVKFAEEYPYEDKADVIQMGNIGLIKAVRNFNPWKGYRFSSFAIPYIKGSIKRGYRDLISNIRLPIRQQQKFNELRDTLQYLSPEEIEVYLEKNFSKSLLYAFLTFNQVELDDDSIEQIDNPGVNSKEIETEVFQKLEQEQIPKILDKLPDTLSQVIKMKFGFNGYNAHSLSEISKRLLIPKSTVFKYYQQATKQILKEVDRGNYVSPIRS